MEIIGTGKITKDEDGNVIQRDIVVEITEKEADMITGVAGRPHQSGRYKPGRNVNISSIYNKVKRINEKHAEIKAAALKVKTDADVISNSIPLD